MARKLPPIETRFKKGQVANPEGGRAHNPALREVRNLTKEQLAELGSLILEKNIGELRKIAEEAKNGSTEHSALKSILATIALKSFSKGDMHALDQLLTRLIGKPKETIELTGKNGTPVKHLVGAMTPEERLREMNRIDKILEESDQHDDDDFNFDDDPEDDGLGF